MLKRKAMVRSKIENAQGLTLSIRADTKTKGNKILPPPDKFHRTDVPVGLKRKNKNSPARNKAIAIKTIIFNLDLSKNVIANQSRISSRIFANKIRD